MVKGGMVQVLVEEDFGDIMPMIEELTTEITEGAAMDFFILVSNPTHGWP